MSLSPGCHPLPRAGVFPMGRPCSAPSGSPWSPESHQLLWHAFLVKQHHTVGFFFPKYSSKIDTETYCKQSSLPPPCQLGAPSALIVALGLRFLVAALTSRHDPLRTPDLRGCVQHCPPPSSTPTSLCPFMTDETTSVSGEGRQRPITLRGDSLMLFPSNSGNPFMGAQNQLYI